MDWPVYRESAPQPALTPELKTLADTQRMYPEQYCLSARKKHSCGHFLRGSRPQVRVADERRDRVPLHPHQELYAGKHAGPLYHSCDDYGADRPRGWQELNIDFKTLQHHLNYELPDSKDCTVLESKVELLLQIVREPNSLRLIRGACAGRSDAFFSAAVQRSLLHQVRLRRQAPLPLHAACVQDAQGAQEFAAHAAEGHCLLV